MMSAPITVCRFITLNSSSVSGPGLFRIDSGIPILPTSCSRAPIRIARSSRPFTPSSSPTATANSAIVCACPPV